MSATDKPAPKPRSSHISTTLKVEEGGHTIYVDSSGMQLGSVSPIHVRPADFDLYHSLFRFAIDEWKRAKEVEKTANEKTVSKEIS